MSEAREESVGTLVVVRVGAFLACSWTWVIGMFLPLLLLRDYGLMGWVIFAVPNVVGAAAMGVLVRSGEASRRMEQHHGRAMQAFAIVTIAFQVYALGALFVPLVGVWMWGVMAVAVLAAVVPLARRVSSLVTLAPLLWLVSVGLIAVGMSRADWFYVEPLRPFTGELTSELVGLALACVFGFGLCPYLDPTFHAARQLADRRKLGGADKGPAAFGVGFGVLFFLMIVGTLLYENVSGFTITGYPAAMEVIGVHVALQAVYTVACHRRAMADTHRRTCPDRCAMGGMSRLMWAGLLLALLVAVDLAVAAALLPGRFVGSYEIGEAFYRMFLGCYGLVFPAYVWLMMVGRDAPPIRSDWVVYAAAVLVALPFFSAGFVGGSMLWTGVGLTVVMLAKGFVSRGAGVTAAG